MLIKKIVLEAMNDNPINLKASLKEELEDRVSKYVKSMMESFSGVKDKE